VARRLCHVVEKIFLCGEGAWVPGRPKWAVCMIEMLVQRRSDPGLVRLKNRKVKSSMHAYTFRYMYTFSWEKKR
jgi:hypothetical protein